VQNSLLTICDVIYIKEAPLLQSDRTTCYVSKLVLCFTLYGS